MYVVIVRFDVDPEHRSTLFETLAEDGRKSIRDEAGTLRFDLIQDETNPNRLYVLEVYADQAALDTHLEGTYYKEAHAAIAKLRANSWVTSERIGRGFSIFPPHIDTTQQ